MSRDRYTAGLMPRPNSVEAFMRIFGKIKDAMGYTGDTNDSATMNIWLHEAVMKSLAKRGG